MAKQTNTKQKQTKTTVEPVQENAELVNPKKEPVINQEYVAPETNIIEGTDVTTESFGKDIPETDANETVIPDEQKNDVTDSKETGDDAIGERVHEPERVCPAQGTYYAKPLTPKSSTAGARVAQSPIRH